MTDSQAKVLSMRAMGKMYGFIKGKFKTGQPNRNGDVFPLEGYATVRHTIIDGVPFMIICNPNATVRGTIVP